MGDMTGEYAGHGRTGTFSVSRNCAQILATWGCTLFIMLKHEEIEAVEWHINGTQDLFTVYLCVQMAF
jgi:hypothetical protein